VLLLLLQAQEQLLEVPWPAKLLEHPYCAPVHLGAACTAKNPAYAAAAAALDAAAGCGAALKDQGPLLMAGLRVRMGINTGGRQLPGLAGKSSTFCSYWESTPQGSNAHHGDLKEGGTWNDNNVNGWRY
jgi:hypothetical protein